MKKQPLNYRIILSTRRQLVYGVSVVLAAVIVCFAVLMPQFQEVGALNTKIAQEEPRTEQLRTKLQALESIVATAEYQQIQVVDEALPSKKPLLELLMSLNTLAQQTGVTVTKFELSPGLVASDSATLQAQLQQKTSAGFDSLRLNLEISGTFQQIQDFLLKIEQISPFSTVIKMDISGEVNSLTQTTDASKPFSASLQTETFFFTQPISVRVDAPLPVIAGPQQAVLQALAAFIPTDLPVQTEVLGGGLEDLFGVNKFNSEAELEAILQQSAAPVPAADSTQQSGATPTATPVPTATP